MQSVSLLLLLAFTGDNAWRRHTIDRSSRGADGVRLADMDRDGLPDVVSPWEEGGRIRVYRNPGPRQVRQPWPTVTVGTVDHPEDAVFVDLDGDGALDVVSSCEGKTRTMFVHWAPTAAESVPAASDWRTTPIPATQQQQQMWMFALPMDVDGAGQCDLVVGSKGPQASIGWLASPERPRDVLSWRYHRWYDAGWIMSLIACDMDADGDLDVLASDRKGPTSGILWLENPGPETTRSGESWRIHRLGAEGQEVMFIARGDLLNRGRPQVVAAVRGEGMRVLDPAALPGQRQLSIPLPDGVGSAKAVAIGDLDTDGHPDLVFSCENASGARSGVRWLSRNEDGAPWSDHEISGPEGVKFDRLELLDLDADGDLDVLTCEERENLGVIWYENPAKESRK